MELTLINLAQMIVANKGLEEPMSLDSLNIYFDEFNESKIKPFGKIKNGVFYPNNKVWKTVIALLIEDSIEYTNRLLNEKEYTYEVYKKYQIGEATFNCYLSKFKLSLLIDMDKFTVYKNGTEVTVVSNQMNDSIRKIKHELEYLEEIVNEASLMFEDQLPVLTIGNKKLAAKFVQRGFGKLTTKTKLTLSEDVLKGILDSRLECGQNSINTELANTIQEDNNICIINTPLSIDKAMEIIDEYEEYYELLRHDIKKNLLGQNYLQLILRIKLEDE